MKRSFTVAMMLVGLLLSSCQRGGQPPGLSVAASTEQPAIEGMERLDPELPTGVHLQAMYLVPPQLDGLSMVHQEMNYLIYLPSGYGEDRDRLWPLILFLHASGAEQFDPVFVMSSGLPAVLFAGEQPEGFSFVVVSPQAFDGETWWSEDTVPTLGGLLDEVLATYSIDPQRVYLTGIGMGGHGAWHLATAYPDRFAAMVSISGSGYQTPLPPEDDTLCRLSELPVWGIHGALDTISEPMASQISLVALEESCQGDVEWTLYGDVGHVGAYERAYRDPALYAWMLDHTR